MPKTNPTTLARQLQDWSQRPSNERHYCTGQLQQIDAALKDPRRGTQLAIGAYLLGVWYLATGQDRVLRGKTDAWDEVRLGASLQRVGLLLRAFSNRASQGGHQPRSRGREDFADLPLLQGANCVAICLSLDEPGAEPLYECFRSLPDTRFGAADCWPLFVREIVSIRAGRRPTLTGRLGPYADIIRHWHGDLDLMARKMPELLDLHLDRTQGKPGEPAEFEEPSVRLFPLEPRMLQAVRQTLNLPTPKFDHSLCFTNLGITSPRGPWPTDVVLTQLQAKLPRRARVRT